jgi:esterase/lipase superfamily enzyme
MREHAVELYSPAIGTAGTVVGYGHWGRPILAFPTERGSAWDFAQHGMVAAVEGLIKAGRVRLYCVDSYDVANARRTGVAGARRQGRRHTALGRQAAQERAD